MKKILVNRIQELLELLTKVFKGGADYRAIESLLETNRNILKSLYGEEI